MNLNELHSFKLSDAIKFHKELNPKLWKNDQLDPLVKKQLLVIAEDFVEELGIDDLDVVDVTISGSNAAFTYTKHSDLDLHILVNMSELHQDAVYRELFRAKKTLYNDTHNITVHGIPVELYVQDSAEPVVSLGEYSILHDKWIKIPKRRSANLDQNATKAKFEQLKDLIQVALKTKHSKKISNALALIRRYRQAGLDKGGEFSPENLAYKAVRAQGAIDALYAMRDKLHSAELTIEEGYAGAKMKFLKPGELRGSHTPAKLMALGFKKSQNGSWFILQSKWDELRKTGQLYETDIVTERLRKEFEDFDPNGKPPGPEFKPTMPAGTVKVDVSDVYDWYKLGQHVSNLKGLGKHDFGQGPPSTILSFGDEETEHKYIKDLEKTGLTTTDIDPVDPNQPKGMKRQKTDPTYNVDSYTDDLDEALDSQPYQYEEISSTHHDYIGSRSQYIFTTEYNLPYIVTIFKYPGDRIRIEFKSKKETSDFRGFGVTGTGDARKVFATVIDIVKKYVGEHHPANITFTASEPSRIRLYDAFLKRLDRELPDYEGKSGPGPVSDDTYFYLKLKNQKIDESLDSQPYPYISTIGTTGAHEYAFTTDDDNEYEAIIINQKFGIHVSFFLKQKQHKNGLIITRTGITGTGNARRVFATVIDIVKKFAAAEKPEAIVFTASEPSRIRLYDAFVKRLDRELPEYAETRKEKGMAEWFVLLRKTKKIDEATDRDSAIKQILKLQNTQGRSPSEIEASKAIIAKLMKRYNIHPKELRPVERNPYQDRINQARSERDVAGDMLKAEWDRFKGGIKDKVSTIFKEDLTEALDSKPYPYEIEEDSIAWQISKFTTSDRNRYKVWVVKYSNKEVSVEFSYQGNDDIDTNSMEIENTGDARRVFATVIEIVKNYAKKYKPNKISFDADPTEPSRIRFYSALVKRTDRMLPDYEDQSTDFLGDFYLVRKGYQVNEASGYIPSKKEANDPRFSTALTVDVKPDSIQKNAKAFGSKTSRAGIPPQARADGKIAESLMQEWKQFLNEDTTDNIFYHVTPAKNVKWIMEEGLTPSTGSASSSYGETEERVYLFPTMDDVQDAVSNWLGDQYEDDIMALLQVDASGINLKSDVEWEYYTNQMIPPNKIKILSMDI